MMMIMMMTGVLDDVVAGALIVALVDITVKAAMRGGDAVPVHHEDAMIPSHPQDVIVHRHQEEEMHHVKKKIRPLLHNAHPNGTLMNMMMIRVRYRHRG